MEKSATLNVFFKSVEPSIFQVCLLGSYLGLSVKQKFRCLPTSLEVHVTTLYINEYLPLLLDI